MRPKCSRSGNTSAWFGRLAPPRIDQIDAGQPVLARDLLRAQMLLHRDRIIGAAFDRRVVGDDHAFAALDAADAGDDAGAVDVAVIHAEGGERRQLQERRAGIEQVLTRSRGSSLPRATWRSRDFSEPPNAASARRACNFAASARIFSALARNSPEFRSIRLPICATPPSPIRPPHYGAAGNEGNASALG